MNLNGVYKLGRLMDLLLEKSKETGQEFYPVMIRVFLYIAERNKKGVTLNQIQRDLNIIQTSVYRAVAALGEGTSKKPEGGLGFVQAVKNPTDYRSKIITLTQEGLVFLNELTDAVRDIDVEEGGGQASVQ